MAIEIDKATRQVAVESITRYCAENMDAPIGNLQADALLEFFLTEIAPVVYNQAVQDVQARMAARVADLDIEIHENAFGYWQLARRRH